MTYEIRATKIQNCHQARDGVIAEPERIVKARVEKSERPLSSTAEQRTHNPLVGGSNPPGATNTINDLPILEAAPLLRLWQICGNRFQPA